MKFIKIIFVIFIVAVLAVCGVSYWLYSSLNKPHQHDKVGKFIVIEKGTTPNEIISKLAREGIISSEYPTLVYLRTFGDAKNCKPANTISNRRLRLCK